MIWKSLCSRGKSIFFSLLLIMRNTRLDSDKYKLLSHFDIHEVWIPWPIKTGDGRYTGTDLWYCDFIVIPVHQHHDMISPQLLVQQLIKQGKFQSWTIDHPHFNVPFPIVIMLGVWLGSDKYKFATSLVWLDRKSNYWSPSYMGCLCSTDSDTATGLRNGPVGVRVVNEIQLIRSYQLSCICRGCDENGKYSA